MRRWRVRQPIPGQSRPDGLFLERIPVHEVDPEYDSLDADLERIAQRLAALRETLAGTPLPPDAAAC